MNANKAVELGFADKFMFTGDEEPVTGILFSLSAVTNSLLSKFPRNPSKPTGTPIESLDRRLNLLSH